MRQIIQLFIIIEKDESIEEEKRKEILRGTSRNESSGDDSRGVLGNDEIRAGRERETD